MLTFEDSSFRKKYICPLKFLGMDKNTTTGLILIGAVMVAFFMLNRPTEQPKEEPIVQNTKEEVVEKLDTNNLVDSEVSIDTVKQEISQEDSLIAAQLLEQKKKIS